MAAPATFTLTPTGEYVHATADGVTTLCGKPAGAERPDMLAALAGFGYEVPVGAPVDPARGLGRWACLTCSRRVRARGRS